MSDTKFTPGLWKAEPVDDSDWGEFEIFEANGDRVAIVVHDRSEVARETSAHLIAAAPELYEALAAIIAKHKGVFGDPPHELENCDMQDIERATAALYKARGES